MNKNIKIEIAVGVILIVAIMVGGLIYFQNKKELQPGILVNKQDQQQGMSSQTQAQSQIQQKRVIDDTQIIAIGADNDMCKTYADSLSKFGKISYGTSKMATNGKPKDI
jgi:hypothetical protein